MPKSIKDLVVLFEEPDGRVGIWLWSSFEGSFQRFTSYHNVDVAYQFITPVATLVCGWGAGVDGFYLMKPEDEE